MVAVTSSAVSDADCARSAEPPPREKHEHHTEEVGEISGHEWCLSRVSAELEAAVLRVEITPESARKTPYVSRQRSCLQRQEGQSASEYLGQEWESRERCRPRVGRGSRLRGANRRAFWRCAADRRCARDTKNGGHRWGSGGPRGCLVRCGSPGPQRGGLPLLFILRSSRTEGGSVDHGSDLLPTKRNAVAKPWIRNQIRGNGGEQLDLAGSNGSAGR